MSKWEHHIAFPDQTSTPPDEEREMERFLAGGAEEAAPHRLSIFQATDSEESVYSGGEFFNLYIPAIIVTQQLTYSWQCTISLNVLLHLHTAA